MPSNIPQPESPIESEPERQQIYYVNLSTNRNEIRMEKLALLKGILSVILVFMLISVLTLLIWYQLLQIQHQQQVFDKFGLIDQRNEGKFYTNEQNLTGNSTFVSAFVLSDKVSTLNPEFETNFTSNVSLTFDSTEYSTESSRTESYLYVTTESTEPNFENLTKSFTQPSTLIPTTLNPIPDSENLEKLNFIKQMTLDSWNAYSKYAWGHDSLNTKSLTKPMQHWFGPNSGHTIVSSLSTLWIMDLKKEFSKGREWIVKNLNFGNINQQVEVCMAVSEYVGGLLSSYALTGEDAFKEKAVEVAQILEPAYNTQTGIPYQKMNPKTGNTSNPQTSINSLGCQQLEYHYLSNITGNQEFNNRAMKMRKSITELAGNSNLYFRNLNVETGNWTSNQAILWLNSLPLEFIQSNYHDSEAIQMFQNQIKSAQEFGLFSKSNQSLQLLYVRELNTTSNTFTEYMSSSNCYLSTALTLAAYGIEQNLLKDKSIKFEQKIKEMARITEFYKLGQELGETCWEASNRSKIGLAPDKFYFNEEEEATNLSQKGAFYFLSPILAESNFILWRLTHNPKYRNRAWEMAKAIHRHCRTASGGYSAIRSVNQIPTEKLNYQRPYFIGGTLKYLYLTFTDDSVLSLDEFVFNSVGHPFPILK